MQMQTFDHQESSEMIKCVPLDYGATFDHQESSEMIKCVPLDYGATFDHQESSEDQMCPSRLRRILWSSGK